MAVGAFQHAISLEEEERERSNDEKDAYGRKWRTQDYLEPRHLAWAHLIPQSQLAGKQRSCWGPLGEPASGHAKPIQIPG
jgi:hypothetical protein